MKITKYEHACLVVEEAGEQLIIDAGELSDSFVVPENPVAVVITHVHGDHFDQAKIESILAKNPSAKIFTVEEVAKELPEAIVVSDGQQETVGPFTIKFSGKDHAIIHKDAPHFQNIAVLVNQKLFYPGDSFTLPGQPVDVLAVPTSGPWLKTAESIDYMLAAKPQQAFNTHDGHLSNNGATSTNSWLSRFAVPNNIDYKVLATGDSIEV